MGRIEAICISRRKGIPKRTVASARLIAAWGISGDAHAGHWHRQVSLLAGESIDEVRKKLPGLAHGAFAENIVTREVDLKELTIGDHIKLGKSLLEITQIGKECHSACIIKKTTGDCIMPREGIFARVINGTTIRPGDQVFVLKKGDSPPNRCACKDALSRLAFGEPGATT